MVERERGCDTDAEGLTSGTAAVLCQMPARMPVQCCWQTGIRFERKMEDFA
jgi:hypothetical protein